MTTYDEVIDIAMISINDYELNKVITISEENFDILQNSSDYTTYIDECNNHIPEFIAPVTNKKYDYIKSQEYETYEDYITDIEKTMSNKLYSYLIKAIPFFDKCPKVFNRDEELKQFNEDLTDIEKSILADLTVLAWLERENNDIRQFRAMLQNKSEANRYSEANLLKERTSKEQILKEVINTRITSYDINNNFKDWKF